MPFGTFTLGDRKANINISGGYGYVSFDGDNSSRALVSVAGMTKIGPKFSLVFDSFILPAIGTKKQTQWDHVTETVIEVDVPRTGGGLIIPGLRYQVKPTAAFQFGFGGLAINGELVPSPIPIVSWFRKL